MFPVNSNVLIGILIFVAILVYVSILRKLEPEKILANITSNEGPRKQKSREEDSAYNKVVDEEERLEETRKKIEKLEEKKPAKKAIKEKERPQETKSETKTNEKERLRDDKRSPPTCSFEFGYLGTLPKNASIPDECLGCPKIIDCLAQK